jgi:hypothetical protein
MVSIVRACTAPVGTRIVVAAAGADDTILFGDTAGTVWRGHSGGTPVKVGCVDGWVTAIAEDRQLTVVGSSTGRLLLLDRSGRRATQCIDASVLEVRLTSSRVTAWDVAGRAWRIAPTSEPVELTDEFVSMPKVSDDGGSGVRISVAEMPPIHVERDGLFQLARDNAIGDGTVALLITDRGTWMLGERAAAGVPHWRLPEGVAPVTVIGDPSGPTLRRLVGSRSAVVRGVVGTTSGQLVARHERSVCGTRPVATWTTGVAQHGSSWLGCWGAGRLGVHDDLEDSAEAVPRREVRLLELDVASRLVGVVALDDRRMLICYEDGTTVTLDGERRIGAAYHGGSCVIGARATDDGRVIAWRRHGQVQWWDDEAA